MTESLTIELHKPGKNEVIRYRGRLLRQSEAHLLLHARWQREAHALPFVTFTLGDHFFEHYFLERPFSIFEVRAPDGRLKGWYANACRPATLRGEVLRSEDLELDLWVPPDRQGIVTLDEDEFAERNYDAATERLARGAIATLRAWAEAGRPPFDGGDGALSLAP
jgi:hypothetical protein